MILKYISKALVAALLLIGLTPVSASAVLPTGRYCSNDKAETIPVNWNHGSPMGVAGWVPPMTSVDVNQKCDSKFMYFNVNFSMNIGTPSQILPNGNPDETGNDWGKTGMIIEAPDNSGTVQSPGNSDGSHGYYFDSEGANTGPASTSLPSGCAEFRTLNPRKLQVKVDVGCIPELEEFRTDETPFKFSFWYQWAFPGCDNRCGDGYQLDEMGSSRPSRVELSPRPITIATIDGNLAVGQLLSIVPGTWTTDDPAFTPSYSWLSCQSATIADATLSVLANCRSVGTGSTYTVANADSGRYITAKVDSPAYKYGVMPYYTKSTGKIVNAPISTSAPVIVGDPEVATVLRLSNGVWSGAAPITYTTTWYRCTTRPVIPSEISSFCKSISGASGSNYTVSELDEGSYVQATVSASNPDGSALALASGALRILARPKVITAPTISGIPALGELINLLSGVWKNTTTQSFTNVWYRCSSKPANAEGLDAKCTKVSSDSSGYRITREDLGFFIVGAVSAANEDGKVTRIASTSFVAAESVAPLASSPALLTGTAKKGASLKTSAGIWNSKTKIVNTYSWYRCSKSILTWSTALPAGCKAIAGQKKATYRLSTSDVGKYVLALVVAKNDVGASKVYTATSKKIGK